LLGKLIKDVKENRTFWLIVVILIILIALYQVDPGPAGERDAWPDGEVYIGITQSLKDQGTLGPREFGNWYYTRPLVPAMAAAIPLQPVRAYLALDILFLLGIAFVLPRLLGRLGLTRTETEMGTLAFLLSHAAMVYLGTALVDAGALFFLFLGAYLVITKRPLPVLALVFTLGVLAKEICLVLPAFYVFWHVFQRRKVNWPDAFVISAIPTAVWIIYCSIAVGHLYYRLAISSVAFPVLYMYLAHKFKVRERNVIPLLLIIFALVYMVLAFLNPPDRSYWLAVVRGDNLELPVAVAGFAIPLFFGLFKSVKVGERKRILASAFPLALPVIAGITFPYVESRVLLPAYPLILVVMAWWLRDKGRRFRNAYWLIFFAGYGVYFMYLFAGKYG